MQGEPRGAYLKSSNTMRNIINRNMPIAAHMAPPRIMRSTFAPNNDTSRK